VRAAFWPESLWNRWCTPGMRSHYAKAPYVATCRVIGQKSAEAIVGVGSRHRRNGDWKRAVTHNVEDITEVSSH